MAEFIGEESRRFEPVAEGDYELIITKINEETVSEGRKTAGATMWRCAYDIGNTTKKVFDNLIFAKGSFWRISNWWRALGHEVVPGQSIDTGDPEEHIGCTLRAHITVTEYNGDKQNDIAYFIEPAPGQPLKRIPADDIKF